MEKRFTIKKVAMRKTFNIENAKVVEPKGEEVVTEDQKQLKRSASALNPSRIHLSRRLQLVGQGAGAPGTSGLPGLTKGLQE
jgi:hypothetical protein